MVRAPSQTEAARQAIQVFESNTLVNRKYPDLSSSKAAISLWLLFSERIRSINSQDRTYEYLGPFSWYQNRKRINSAENLCCRIVVVLNIEYSTVEGIISVKE